MKTPYTLVTALDGAVPTLSGSSTQVVEVDDVLQENSRSYFCYGGHDFTLIFAAGLETPYFFECPECATVAFCCPVEDEARQNAKSDAAAKKLVGARA